MRTFIWVALILVVALWSGVAWIVARLIGFGGYLLANHAGAVPPTGGSLAWLASAGSGLGEWIVFAVWLLVTAFIAAIGLVIEGSLPRRSFAAETG